MSTTTMHSGSPVATSRSQVNQRPSGDELSGHQIRRLALGAALLSWAGIFLLFKLI